MTTVRKLPTARPNGRAITIRISTSSVSALTAGPYPRMGGRRGTSASHRQHMLFAGFWQTTSRMYATSSLNPLMFCPGTETC